MKKSEKTESEAQRPNLYDLLKVLALWAMLVDHIGYYLFPQVWELRFLGRFAFPIFLFLVGFNGAYRWRWKLFRRGIGLQAVMCFVAWKRGLGSFTGNILIVILLARALMNFLGFWKEKEIKSRMSIGIGLLLILLHPWLVKVLDYGSLSFFLVFRGRTARKQEKLFWLGIPILLWLLIQNLLIFDFGFREGAMTLPLLLWTGYALLFLVFAILKEKNLTLKGGLWLKKGILFLSQQSLAFYGLHILVLLALSLWKRKLL